MIKDTMVAVNNIRIFAIARRIILNFSSLGMVLTWKVVRNFIAITLFALPAWAGQEVIGMVTHVRDADTIEVRGIPIRFDGVDGRWLCTALQML